MKSAKNFALVFITHLIVPFALSLLKVEFPQNSVHYHRAFLTAVYDGDDCIYLFNGISHEPTTNHKDIQCYSISKDTLEVVGEMPTAMRGSVQIDGSGNIYFFPEANRGTIIWKYNPVNNTIEDYLSWTSSLISPVHKNLDGDPDIFYGVGDFYGGMGPQNSILEFDMRNNVINRIAVLPYTSHQTAAAGGIGNNSLFAFGANGRGGVFRVDLESLVIENAPPDMPWMGVLTAWPEAVTDGDKYIYLVGGWNSKNGRPPVDGLIQFNMKTWEWKFFPVQGFPVTYEEETQYSPYPVYVKKLNRIYFFGGTTRPQDVIYDEVWYIDLTPLSQDGVLNNCDGLENGLYPHPEDCSQFIGCHNGKLHFFKCPESLRFDVTGKKCYFKDLVTCPVFN